MSPSLEQLGKLLHLDRPVMTRLEDAVRASGLSASEFLKRLVESVVARPHMNGDQPPDGQLTPFEIAHRAGLIGCLSDTPPDLSTNKAHFDGFGRD